MDAQNSNFDRWLAALRSNQYRKGKDCLSKDGQFCCLGVACELAKEQLNLVVGENDKGQITYDGYNNLLPPNVRHWLGLRVDNGAAKGYEALKDRNGNPIVYVTTTGAVSPCNMLPTLNDNTDLTFPEIADIIEINKDLLC